VNLLEQHHAQGRRFQPQEYIEEGPRVAVRLAVTDAAWDGAGETFKVFTFRPGGDDAVLLQDCIDRDDALRLLAQPE
jgi:hypothetical protein